MALGVQRARAYTGDARRGDPGAEEKFGEPWPQGITAFVERFADLGKPFLVTENGYADALDRVRPWVIVEAARRMHDLIARGFDLRGYHHWTLVDNFEWDVGWDLRFGLYELNLATQERLPRPSAALYGAIARENALTPECFRRRRWLGSAVGAVLDGALGPVVPGRVGPEDPLCRLESLAATASSGPAGSRSRARAHATP